MKFILILIFIPFTLLAQNHGAPGGGLPDLKIKLDVAACKRLSKISDDLEVKFLKYYNVERVGKKDFEQLMDKIIIAYTLNLLNTEKKQCTKDSNGQCVGVINEFITKDRVHKNEELKILHELKQVWNGGEGVESCSEILAKDLDKLSSVIKIYEG
jgi:hypothetical protein